MNKRELVADVAAKTGRDPAEVAEVVDAVVDSIVAAVAAGEKVVIQGFGTFMRRARARRVARDINADRPVVVPATHVPAFTPGKPFREIVALRRRRRAPAGTRSRARTPTVLRRRPAGAGATSGRAVRPSGRSGQ